MIPEPEFNTAQKELYELMSEISETIYCAGWQMGNEAFLWNVLKDESLMGRFLTPENRARLQRIRELSKNTNGWIIWWDDDDEPGLDSDHWGPRFIGLDDWKNRYANDWGGDK